MKRTREIAVCHEKVARLRKEIYDVHEAYHNAHKEQRRLAQEEGKKRAVAVPWGLFESMACKSKTAWYKEEVLDVDDLDSILRGCYNHGGSCAADDDGDENYCGQAQYILKSLDGTFKARLCHGCLNDEGCKESLFFRCSERMKLKMILIDPDAFEPDVRKQLDELPDYLENLEWQREQKKK